MNEIKESHPLNDINEELKNLLKKYIPSIRMEGDFSGIKDEKKVMLAYSFILNIMMKSILFESEANLLDAITIIVPSVQEFIESFVRVVDKEKKSQILSIFSKSFTNMFLEIEKNIKMRENEATLH